MSNAAVTIDQLTEATEAAEAAYQAAAALVGQYPRGTRTTEQETLVRSAYAEMHRTEAEKDRVLAAWKLTDAYKALYPQEWH